MKSLLRVVFIMCRIFSYEKIIQVEIFSSETATSLSLKNPATHTHTDTHRHTHTHSPSQQIMRKQCFSFRHSLDIQTLTNTDCKTNPPMRYHMYLWTREPCIATIGPMVENKFHTTPVVNIDGCIQFCTRLLSGTRFGLDKFRAQQSLYPGPFLARLAARSVWSVCLVARSAF